MKIYKSKVSRLLVLLLVLQLCIPFLWGKETSWWFLGVIFIYLSCMTYMVFFIRYIVQEQRLLITIGGIKATSIDIKTICKIEKTNSILSSPAASLDRIEIFYNRYDSIILSPKNTKGFIADLLAINPDIYVKI